MLLTAVAGLRAELGFDDMTDVNEAIKGALHAAEVHLEAILDTVFAEAEVSDTFYAHEPGFVRGSHVETVFRLSRGLLAGAGTAVYSTDVDLADSTTLENLVWDLTRGVVRDHRTAFDRQYVRFTYTSGFSPDGSDPESYDLGQVPGWLQQAAKLQALIGLETHPVMEEAGVRQDTKQLRQQLDTMVRGRLRYAPNSLLPL